MSCCGSSVLVISSAVSLLRLLVSCRWFYTVMTKVDWFDRVDHGDVIVAAQGAEVKDPSQVINAVERAGVGGTLNLTVNRRGALVNLRLVPGDMAVLRQG